MYMNWKVKYGKKWISCPHKWVHYLRLEYFLSLQNEVRPLLSEYFNITHTFYYLPWTLLFYNWKIGPFTTFSHFMHPPAHHFHTPIWQATICSLYVWVQFFFQIPLVSKSIQYLYFSMTYFAQHNTLKVLSCYHRWRNFLLLYGWIVFHSVRSHTFLPIPLLMGTVDNLHFCTFSSSLLFLSSVYTHAHT